MVPDTDLEETLLAEAGEWLLRMGLTKDQINGAAISAMEAPLIY